MGNFQNVTLEQYLATLAGYNVVLVVFFPPDGVLTAGRRFQHSVYTALMLTAEDRKIACCKQWNINVNQLNTDGLKTSIIITHHSQ